MKTKKDEQLMFLCLLTVVIMASFVVITQINKRHDSLATPEQMIQVLGSDTDDATGTQELENIETEALGL